jgi:hypothetical protein
MPDTLLYYITIQYFIFLCFLVFLYHGFKKISNKKISTSIRIIKSTKMFVLFGKIQPLPSPDKALRPV